VRDLGSDAGAVASSVAAPSAPPRGPPEAQIRSPHPSTNGDKPSSSVANVLRQIKWAAQSPHMLPLQFQPERRILRRTAMRAFKKTMLTLGAAIIVATFVSPTFAATTVKVILWDKGAATPMGTGMGYGMPLAAPSKATMGVTATPATAAAGVVSFQVTNTSKDTVHEMILVYLADPKQPLTYSESDSKLVEDKIGYIGEVSELDPGKSGTLTKVLKPGEYLLICNVAGHFMAGMWTKFEVTK
jgi:uncharacterized cupredoxin-like copper-binding protein